MKIPDRFNPRLWLRDWLNKQSPRERAAAKASSERASTLLDSRINTAAQGEPKAVEYGRGLTPLNLTEVRSVRFSAEERPLHPVGVAVSRLPATHSQLSPPVGLTASTRSESEVPSSPEPGGSPA